jgi:hypothetical protein
MQEALQVRFPHTDIEVKIMLPSALHGGLLQGCDGRVWMLLASPRSGRLAARLQTNRRVRIRLSAFITASCKSYGRFCTACADDNELTRPRIFSVPEVMVF